jgi:hypothetical protein
LALVALVLCLAHPPMEQAETTLCLVLLPQSLAVEVHQDRLLTTPQALAVLEVAALSLLLNQQERLALAVRVILAVAIPAVALAAAEVAALPPMVAMVVQAMVAMAVLPPQVLFLAHQHNMLVVVVAADMAVEILEALAVAVALVMAGGRPHLFPEEVQQQTQALVAVVAQMMAMVAMAALVL